MEVVRYEVFLGGEKWSGKRKLVFFFLFFFFEQLMTDIFKEISINSSESSF